jgi:hypothetical protein
VVELDPERVLRFNHYRDTPFKDTVEDGSMAQYRDAIEAEIVRQHGLLVLALGRGGRRARFFKS